MKSVVLVSVVIGIVVVALLASCSSVHRSHSPFSILHLQGWKLQIPTDRSHSGTGDQIQQPDLESYSSRFFRTNKQRTAVIFRAPVGGTIIKGSDFPRTELREMSRDGRTNIAWSTRSQTHSMELREAITALPPVHPSLVAGQLHDADQYIVLIRLDGSRLYVKAGGREVGLLTDSYELGTVFTVKIVATADAVEVYYNGDLKASYSYTCKTCYFKAGVYLQTNTGYHDDPSSYGEVTVYSLKTHVQ